VQAVFRKRTDVTADIAFAGSGADRNARAPAAGASGSPPQARSVDASSPSLAQRQQLNAVAGTMELLRISRTDGLAGLHGL
jgi:hypothetical protein